MAKNFEHIVHKNSSALVDNNPKLPTSGQLEYGEIAINYAKDKETISLKNSNNEIVTFTSDKKLDNYVTVSDFDDDSLVVASALNDLEEKKADKDDLTNLINNVYTKEEIDNNHLVISSSLNDLNTRLNTKQDTLVSGINIKTINNQSILGSGNITLEGGSGSGGGGDINVIESVKVNGSALTPDANKAVNITAVPASIVTQDTTYRFVSDSEKTTWDNKVSNVQADWNATSGLSQILNKPTIPVAVTESTVSGWGFTKNTGTVTGVKMNGTTKNPTSGVVDLGTVITSETTLSKGSTSGTGNAVTDITVSGHQITLTKGTTFLTQHQSIKTLNGTALTGAGNITLTGVPAFSASDNGKILGVVNGQLAWVTPTTIYTGSGTPSSSTGNDGDIYLQTT